MSDIKQPSLILMGSGAGGTARFLWEAVSAGKLPIRIAALVTDNPQSGLVRLAEEAALPLFILPFPAASSKKRLPAGGGASSPQAEKAGRIPPASEPAPNPDPALEPIPKTAAEWDGALLKILQKQRPDWILLAGFLRKIGPQTLAAFQNKILNTHPSLLPKFGGKGMHGLNVYRAVCRSGVKETGVSVHIVTKNYDEGPVLVQEKTAVRPSDTPEILQERVKLIEKALLKKFLGRLARREIFLPRSRRDRLILFLKGGLLGLASVLPGVSGGTAAFLLNIYEKLVLEISKTSRLFFNRRFPPFDFGFCLPLLSGAALSVFAFSSLVLFVIQKAPVLFKILVFCLIIGSLYFPLKTIRKSAGNIFAAALSGILTAAAFYFFPGSGESGGDLGLRASLFPSSDPLRLFSGGLIAGPALVLPGLSGSYILILLGLYEAALEAVKNLRIVPLFFFAAGAAGGGILAAGLMNRLLKRFPEKTNAVIVGLIAGSLVYLARL